MRKFLSHLWRAIAAYIVYLAVTVVMFWILLSIEGNWYFGRRPQWTIAIDSAGLTIGRSIDPVKLGWFPLFILYVPIILFTLWFLYRKLVRHFYLPPEPRRDGLCAVCGYDVRACSGRCSECGTPLPVTKS